MDTEQIRLLLDKLISKRETIATEFRTQHKLAEISGRLNAAAWISDDEVEGISMDAAIDELTEELTQEINAYRGTMQELTRQIQEIGNDILATGSRLTKAQETAVSAQYLYPNALEMVQQAAVTPPNGAHTATHSSVSSATNPAHNNNKVIDSAAMPKNNNSFLALNTPSPLKKRDAYGA